MSGKNTTLTVALVAMSELVSPRMKYMLWNAVRSANCAFDYASYFRFPTFRFRGAGMLTVDLALSWLGEALPSRENENLFTIPCPVYGLHGRTL
jgi:hypothetical protein